MEMIRSSNELQKHWDKYRSEFDYAKDITFEDTCDSVVKIMNTIVK